MVRFSAPLSLPSTAACWPVRLIRSRTRAASLVTSKPATVALPASGRSSVARIRMVVVLPAPFGPSSATTSPAPTVRSTSSSTTTRLSPLPNDLPNPVASTTGFGAAHPRLLVLCRY